MKNELSYEWALINAVNWHSYTDLVSAASKQMGQVQFGFLVGDSTQTSLHYPNQVHGNQMVQAHLNHTKPQLVERSSGDGIWTRGFESCAIRSADCLPLLLSIGTQTETHAVAALHCGWRSLAGGLISAGVKTLCNETKLSPAHVRVTIGPAICREHFEVGPEILEAFSQGPIALSPMGLALCSHKGLKDRWHFDLVTAAVLALGDCQIDPHKIQAVRECTFLNSQRWPSFRRTGLRRQQSIWSWIRRQHS